MDNYNNVTLAGFHALHRQVWGKIAKNLITDVSSATKSCAMKQLNLPEVSHLCFACAVSIRLTESTMHYHNCNNCPVVSWGRRAEKICRVFENILILMILFRKIFYTTRFQVAV